MHPVTRVIDRYHQLLAEEDPAPLWADFAQKLAENNLVFGERPICSVLRPLFLHRQEYEQIAQATRLVMDAIHALYRAMRRGELEMTRLLALSPGEARLTQLPDTYGRPDVSARMDAFWLRGDALGQGDLYFLEYNADSPGGLAYGDVLGDLFETLPPMQRLAQEATLSRHPVRQEIVETLLACYGDWCRATGRTPQPRPHIAIVDWRTVRTRSEFVLITRSLEAAGCRVRICDPDELSVRDGRLWAGDDFPVDLVYKRLVVNELINRYPEPDALMAHPLVQAVAQDQVCIANHFNCQLLYNKAIFALLSDEANAHLFRAEERAAIQRHIPWTRLVADRETVIDGAPQDLVAYIRENQHELVLKPVREYGGTGVLLGWEMEPSAWEDGLRQALSSPTIVQRRVPTPREQFPVVEGGELRLVERMMDIDPYVWQGERVAHAGVRLGAQALLNVSAGGGSAVPLFIVE